MAFVESHAKSSMVRNEDRNRERWSPCTFEAQAIYSICTRMEICSIDLHVSSDSACLIDGCLLGESLQKRCNYNMVFTAIIAYMACVALKDSPISHLTVVFP